MSVESEEHIAEAEAFYRPIIAGPGSRLLNGAKLWRQHGEARDAYRRGSTDFVPVYERINEMAAAYVLLSDPTLRGGSVGYEMPVANVRSLIDFTVSWPDGRTLYIEAKTVHPRTDDSAASWANFEERRAHHPKNLHYLVDKDWIGAKLYGDSFAARSSFMTYSRQFEERLAAANEVRRGDGVLLFCGTGFPWHLSELEDFADFYRLGAHRQDDAFARMEARSLAERSIALKRNIGEFAYMKRPMNSVPPESWLAKVEGPRRGRGAP